MAVEPRSVEEIVRRLTLSYAGYERTRVERLLASGELQWEEADDWAGNLSAVPTALFDRDAMESTESRILMAPTGEVPRDLLMRNHWRIECVGVFAWALEWLDAIPPITERFDDEAIDKVVPRTPDEVERAFGHQLRPDDELERMRERLADERREAFDAYQSHERDRERAVRNSRSLERYRAALWLTEPDSGPLQSIPANPPP